DDVGRLGWLGDENAAIRDAGLRGAGPRRVEERLPDVDADHATRPLLRHLDCLGAGSAAEIDDRLAANLGEEAIAEQRPQLADVPVRGTGQATGFLIWSNPREQSVTQSATNESHGSLLLSRSPALR